MRAPERERELTELTGEELRRDLARRMSRAQAAWLAEHRARVEVLGGPPYFRVRPDPGATV